MTATPATTTPAVRRHLPDRAGLWLLASVIVVFLAASSAPTPLYATYQAEWGFSPVTTTVVFGVYAVSVLLALLVAGRLSDHLGRRPVVLAAIAAQAAALVLLATADGVGPLLLARVVQGLAAGAALGPLGAGMIDLDRVLGTTTNATVPAAGTALGALGSALVVQFLPAPTHLVYLVLAAILVLQGVGVTLLRETSAPVPGALGSLVPRVALPRQLRRGFATAAPVLFAVWALAGFYGSLAPSLLRELVGSTSALWGGLGLFLLAGVASAATLVLRDVPARRVMLTGIPALVAGVGLTVLAVPLRSPTLFLIGSAVAGIGFGSGHQGAIRSVVPGAAPHERAGVLSLLYIVCYLGMGVPSVLAGLAVVHGGGLEGTARGYGVAVVVLAAAALPGLLRRRGARSPLAAGPVCPAAPAQPAA